MFSYAVGLALLGFLALVSMKKVNDSLIYLALAVFFIGEGMSRYLFYVIGA